MRDPRPPPVCPGRSAGALLAAVLIAAACAVPGAAPAQGSPTVSRSDTRTPVPPGLSALESSAEDIVDVALAHDRTRVLSLTATLRAHAGTSTATVLLNAVARPAEIAALRNRAALVARSSHSAPLVSVALAANAVSDVVAAEPTATPRPTSSVAGIPKMSSPVMASRNSPPAGPYAEGDS